MHLNINLCYVFCSCHCYVSSVIYIDLFFISSVAQNLTLHFFLFLKNIIHFLKLTDRISTFVSGNSVADKDSVHSEVREVDHGLMNGQLHFTANVEQHISKCSLSLCTCVLLHFVSMNDNYACHRSGR